MIKIKNPNITISGGGDEESLLNDFLGKVNTFTDLCSSSDLSSLNWKKINIYNDHATKAAEAFLNCKFPEGNSINMSLPNVTTVSSMFQRAQNCGDIVLSLPSCHSFGALFYGTNQSSGDNINVTVNSLGSATSMSYFLTDAHVSTATLNFLTGGATNWQAAFPSRLTAIYGVPLNFASLNSGINMFQYSKNLTHVRFEPNTLSISLNMYNTPLNDDSLISLANCLNATVSKTLTIGDTTVKSRCTDITGTVSQVTEDDVTYDFFTADDAGTTTLEYFITTTKGWTIA